MILLDQMLLYILNSDETGKLWQVSDKTSWKNLFFTLIEIFKALDTLERLGGFAENYRFMVRDTLQGYHWDNSPSYISSICCLFQDDKLVCESVCMISDNLKHDTVAGHAFQKGLIPYLQQLISRTKLYTLVMALHHSIKILKILLTYVAIFRILEWMWSGIFCH